MRRQCWRVESGNWLADGAVQHLPREGQELTRLEWRPVVETATRGAATVSRRPRHDTTRHEAARAAVHRQEGGGGEDSGPERHRCPEGREFTVAAWTKVERRPGGSKAHDMGAPVSILSHRCRGRVHCQSKVQPGPSRQRGRQDTSDTVTSFEGARYRAEPGRAVCPPPLQLTSAATPALIRYF